MNPQQTQLIMMILIFAVFYFVLILPQQKAQKKALKDHKEMIASLKKNDEVVTSGGIHGVVVNVKESTIMLRVDDNTKIEIQKNSISSIKRKASE